MLRKFVLLFLMSLQLPNPALASSPTELAEQGSLLFSFTGRHAREFYAFLKDRTPQQNWIGFHYYGDMNTFACSEYGECRVFLGRREWNSTTLASGKAVVLNFTAPLKGLTLDGNLTITAGDSPDEKVLHLEVRDLLGDAAITMSKPVSCPDAPYLSGTALSPGSTLILKGDGDCQLYSFELERDLGDPESMQFIGNVGSIAFSFEGPLAKELYHAASPAEPDVGNPNYFRVQLGPELYCWKLDTFVTNSFREPYVCEAQLRNDRSDRYEFWTEGLAQKKGKVRLGLKANFKDFLFDDFTFLYENGDKTREVASCPNQDGNPETDSCHLRYDYPADPGIYPIDQLPLQGFSVGWGVTSEPESTDEN